MLPPGSWPSAQKQKKMKTTAKGLSLNTNAAPVLFTFSFPQLLKKKKKYFRFITLELWTRDSCLPRKENISSVSVFQERETHGGGFGKPWLGGRADPSWTTSLVLNANDLCRFITWVLFSRQSGMFLFLIIARPDANCSPATCWKSEKANS